MFKVISNNEKEFIYKCLACDCRIDARSRLQTRLQQSYAQSPSHDPKIIYGEENGQVQVQMGQTKVLTGASLKIVTPKAGKPNLGELKFNVEFASLAHDSEYYQQTANLSEMRFEISEFISTVVKNSMVTDRAGLCIQQGVLAWSLTIELQCLNDDGNLFDAMFLAAILALKNTRLPEVSLTKDNDCLCVSNDTSKQRYLSVHYIPVCTTFYFGLGDEPFVDACAQEEKLCSARLSIAVNLAGEICGISSLGVINIDPGLILKCSKQALAIAQDVSVVVRDAWENKNRNSLILKQKFTQHVPTNLNQISLQVMINSLPNKFSSNFLSKKEADVLHKAQDQEIDTEIIQVIKKANEKRSKSVNCDKTTNVQANKNESIQAGQQRLHSEQNDQNESTTLASAELREPIEFGVQAKRQRRMQQYSNQ